MTVKARDKDEIRMSWIVVYVRDDVRYDRREHLENDKDAMYWMDIKMDGKRKITCGFIYREFQLWRQPWSRTIEEQGTRWICIVESWNKAGEREIWWQ